jgi:hypothetical protein
MTARIDTLYPGYDVLRKRDTPSWDGITRQVIEQRLSTPDEPRFFDAVEWAALRALCDCIVPQRANESRVPLAALLDAKLHGSSPGDGYRDARLPPMRQAWKRGLAALDAECRAVHELPFASVTPEARIALLHRAQLGDLRGPAWLGMPSDVFFANRILHDICGIYYSHPYAWSEIGFGGPANPRGYVRMVSNRRDPWEPKEIRPGKARSIEKENRGVQ